MSVLAVAFVAFLVASGVPPSGGAAAPAADERVSGAQAPAPDGESEPGPAGGSVSREEERADPDADVVRNLELLEKIELLDRLELFDAQGD